MSQTVGRVCNVVIIAARDGNDANNNTCDGNRNYTDDVNDRNSKSDDKKNPKKLICTNVNKSFWNQFLIIIMNLLPALAVVLIMKKLY